ncbi:hypothetical protein ACLEPN_15195 [Myxococcus sp. 1LA]
MSAQAPKKLSLKKETLRQVDTAQLGQLEGAVGGTPPVVVLTITFTISHTIITNMDP